MNIYIIHINLSVFQGIHMCAHMCATVGVCIHITYILPFTFQCMRIIIHYKIRNIYQVTEFRSQHRTHKSLILFSGMAVTLILKWLLYSFGVRAKQQKAMQLLEALNFQPLLKFLSLERGAENWVNNHLHSWNETPVKVYTMR